MYHTRAALLFGAKQTAEGTPATLTGAKAIAATEITFTPEYDMDTEKYLGEITDRSVILYEKDRYGKLDFTTVMPVLDTADDIPLSDWLECCGVAKDVSVDDEVTFDNSTLVHNTLTTAFRRSSTQTSTEKQFLVTDTVFQLGVDFAVGQLAKLSFTGMGEFDRSTSETALVPDYGTQKTAIAPVQKKGTYNTLWGATPICVESWSTSNFFGVDIERSLLLCGESFELTGTESEVTLTVAERDVNVNFDPETFLGTGDSFQFTLGTDTGKTVVLTFSSLKIESWSPTTVGNYAAQQIRAISDGTATITFE